MAVATPTQDIPPKPPKSAAARWALYLKWLVAAIVIFNLTAILVARVWLSGLDIAMANLVTGGGIVLSGLVLWGWFVLFSDYPFLLKGAVVLATGGLFVLTFGIVREVRFNGEMIPRFYTRWEPVADRVLAAPAPAAIEESKPFALADEVGFPQFLGPDRTGYLAKPNLAKDWKTNPPKERWRTKIGAGWSGFAAHSGRAVTLEQRGESELITCYDVETGNILWSHANETRHDEVMGGVGPRSTPTIDGERVYAVGATGILSCLDFRTGKMVWEDDLRSRAGTTPAKDSHLVQWGRSNSPLVLDEKLIVPLGGMTEKLTSLIAYHKETGDVVWKGGEQQISYASPIVAELCGRQQVVIVNEASVAGHEPDSGKELWRFQWFGHSNTDATVSQPHVLSDDRIFISKGYQGGAKLLKVTESDGEFAVDVVWENAKVLKTKFTNCVLIGDYAYGLSDSTLECVDWQTGKSQWKKGRYGQGQILGVGDAILVQAEPGFVALVAASPDKFSELGRIEALSDKTWNNLCVYRNLLLVRNSVEAACYELTLDEE